MTQLSFDDVEFWLPIAGYEGLYEISSFGRVKSAPRATTRGGIMKTAPAKGGYVYVTLTRDGKQQRRAVHQLVAAAFIGPRPAGRAGQAVRHWDGASTNNHFTNLLYGSQRENALDRLRHGTDPNAAKTHCPRDHEYTAENTFILKSGSRICRTCARIRGNENRRKHFVFQIVTLTCPGCGTDFERAPVHGQGHRSYCSLECKKEAQRVARNRRYAERKAGPAAAA